jgi:CheY-like chemotaxis protein
MIIQPVVLYVEDEPSSRKVMRMIAKDMGLENLTLFEDSSDFMARVAALPLKPQIIFLDIHVKPHTGFEMLKMLRDSGQYTGVPIVAMTASVMNEEVGQLRTAGFDGCLAKPIDIDTFPDTVRRILAGEVIWRIID